MPALAQGLRQLGGLRQLYLVMRHVPAVDVYALAPALWQLTCLSQLRLEFFLMNNALLREVGMALVVPGAASVAEARKRHWEQRMQADGGRGLLNLRLLDVSHCMFADHSEADLELLTPAVKSLPQLEEVVVGRLLRADGPDLASSWGVRVTAESGFQKKPAQAL